MRQGAADAPVLLHAAVSLVLRAKESGVPILCAMGAGNKLDPTAFRIGDLSETSVCPLAKVMRREPKKRGVEHLKVVYSQEPPLAPPIRAEGKRITGSTAFVPSVVGLIMAGEAIKDLIHQTGKVPS